MVASLPRNGASEMHKQAIWQEKLLSKTFDQFRPAGFDFLNPLDRCPRENMWIFSLDEFQKDHSTSGSENSDHLTQSRALKSIRNMLDDGNI